MPVKQHHAYQLAVKIVRAREQRQRIAEGNLMQCKCSHFPMNVNQELLSNDETHTYESRRVQSR